VPPADGFEVLYADELAEPTRGDYLLHLTGVGRVAHDVADREDDPGIFDRVDHLDALRPRGCDRLFKQYVVAQLGEAACRTDVLAVWRGDDHGIGKPRQRHELPPVVETFVGRHPELIGQHLTATGAWIGDGHDASPVRILKNAAGARALERLRPLAVGERFFRRRSQRVWIAAPDTKDRPDDDLSGYLQTAAIVREFHLGRRNIRHFAGTRYQAHALDQIADRPSGEMRVAVNGAADRTGRPRPGFETGASVINRPSHQTIHRHGAVGAQAIAGDLDDLAASRANHQSADPGVGHEHVRSAAENGCRNADAARHPQCRHELGGPVRFDEPIGVPTHSKCREGCERHVGANAIDAELLAQRRLDVGHRPVSIDMSVRS